MAITHDEEIPNPPAGGKSTAGQAASTSIMAGTSRQIIPAADLHSPKRIQGPDGTVNETSGPFSLETKHPP
jgi:hypothetical protein